ncbi:MAG: hypothetical protein ABIA74_01660 [bacterium]
MFIVLLDDVADKMKNKKLLAEILKIPIENKINFRNCPKKKYLQLTKKVWRSLNKKICSFPLYKNFEEIIEYDLKQIINGMDYAYLVNKNFYLINETESTIYLSFNTPGTISYMIDLTCMKNFKMRNLGIVRKIAWYTQVMTRIANWVVTWEREIKEKDFTSGIFAYALENNFINIENLKNNDTEIILKIRESGAENYFLKEWDNLYNKINKLNKKNQDINIKAILKQIKLLTVLHLISRNLI